jgi:WD40 repeat protein
VDPPLVDTLVGDVEGEPGALPLLSTALLELWHRRQGRRIPLQAYLDTGGVHGAVARLAEDAYGELSEEQRMVARAIMHRLAAPGEEEAAVRRRVPLSDLDTDRPDVARALAVLTARRLLTVSEGTVEVAHEALLREWPRLRGWLDEDRADRRLRQHLTEQAKEWRAADRDAAELYRGARLASALDWTGEHDMELNELEREFLARSREASEREAERARRTNRRLLGLLSGVAVFLVLALVAGSLAFVQRSHARREAARAAREARVADARRLITEAFVENRLERSLLLALGAVSVHDSVETQSALLAMLLRGQGAIRVSRSVTDLSTLAIAPDGRKLAAGDQYGDVILFDPRMGPPMDTGITGPEGSVAGMAFSPDGRRLSFVAESYLVLVDVDTGTTRVVYPEEDAVIDPRPDSSNRQVVTYSPDGETVARLISRGDPPKPVVLLYNATTGELLRRLSLQLNGLPDGLAFLPDGGKLVTLTETQITTDTQIGGEGTILVWDLESMEPIQEFHHPGGRMTLSPDGATVAIGRPDGSVFMVNLLTGKRRDMLGHHREYVSSIGFSPDGHTLVSGGGEGSVIVWDVASRKPRETLSGDATPVCGVAFSPGSTTFYTSSQDGSIITWDLSGERRLIRPLPGVVASGVHSTMALSPNGTVLAIPQRRGTVVLWDLTKGSRVAELHAQTLPGYVALFGIGVAFSPDGRQLATAGQHPDEVVLWDLGKRSPIGAPFRHERATRVAFSPDGKTLASGSDSGQVILWDVSTGKSLARKGVKGSVSDLDFSPDGQLLAIAGTGTVGLWNAARREEVFSFAVGGPGPTATDFSADGRVLAIGDYEGRISLWDTETGKQLGRRLIGQSGGGSEVSVLSVDFSPDGTRLVSSDTTGATYMWDVASHRLMGKAQLGGRLLIQFTPDGRTVLALSSEGAFIWDVDPRSWKALACLVAGRGFTRQEWNELLPGRPYQALCPP